eukprot:3370339-Prymnesium_polylepis.1
MNTLNDEVPVNVDIYQHLWKAQAHINVPDTIVYRYGRIDSWFFNGKASGKGPAPVMRKRQFSIRHAGIMERIETAMGSDAAGPNEVIAVWMAGEPGEPSIVLHLTKTSLHHFLTNVPDKGHGILQRFVKPFGGHNSLVRSVRTPHHFALDFRVNWYATTDTRIPLAQRLATFEGGVRHVNTSAVNRHLHGEAEQASETVMDAVDAVYCQRWMKVWSLTLNFKLDADACLWLVSCSEATLAVLDG